MAFKSFQEYWDTHISKLNKRGFGPASINDIYDEALSAWDACVNNYPFREPGNAADKPECEDCGADIITTSDHSASCPSRR